MCIWLNYTSVLKCMCVELEMISGWSWGTERPICGLGQPPTPSGLQVDKAWHSHEDSGTLFMGSGSGHTSRYFWGPRRILGKKFKWADSCTEACLPHGKEAEEGRWAEEKQGVCWTLRRSPAWSPWALGRQGRTCFSGCAVQWTPFPPWLAKSLM